jgi:hypothetical protein
MNFPSRRLDRANCGSSSPQNGQKSQKPALLEMSGFALGLYDFGQTRFPPRNTLPFNSQLLSHPRACDSL